MNRNNRHTIQVEYTGLSEPVPRHYVPNDNSPTHHVPTHSAPQTAAIEMGDSHQKSPIPHVDDPSIATENHHASADVQNTRTKESEPLHNRLEPAMKPTSNSQSTSSVANRTTVIRTEQPPPTTVSESRSSEIAEKPLHVPSNTNTLPKEKTRQTTAGLERQGGTDKM